MEEAKHDKITQITGCQYRTRPIKPRLRAFWGVKKREGRMSDAIVNAVFRMSMDDFIRRLKRTDQFRHPLFAASELFDPLDPVNPFTAQGPLPIVERVWHFSRDSVPEYIKLWVGREARERVLTGIKADYDLPPEERFKRIQRDVKCELYDFCDPETWDTGFFCLIEMPLEYNT